MAFGGGDKRGGRAGGGRGLTVKVVEGPRGGAEMLEGWFSVVLSSSYYFGLSLCSVEGLG